MRECNTNVSNLGANNPYDVAGCNDEVSTRKIENFSDSLADFRLVEFIVDSDHGTATPTQKSKDEVENELGE